MRIPSPIIVIGSLPRLARQDAVVLHPVLLLLRELGELPLSRRTGNWGCCHNHILPAQDLPLRIDVAYYQLTKLRTMIYLKSDHLFDESMERVLDTNNWKLTQIAILHSKK
jgi:hypothetical protein